VNANDSAKAADGIRVDRRLAVPADDQYDHLRYLEEEIADAEQRVKDATDHLQALKKQKQERS
jgi:uncharacterized protein (DUF342 family)